MYLHSPVQSFHPLLPGQGHLAFKGREGNTPEWMQVLCEIHVDFIAEVFLFTQSLYKIIMSLLKFPSTLKVQVKV